MARNKITFERTWDDVGRATYIFTGSQRQPTLVEIQDWIEAHNPMEIGDPFMVCAIKCQDLSGGYQSGYGEGEESKTVELWGYSGGRNDGSCPICGHERDLSESKCPVCDRPWEE